MTVASGSQLSVLRRCRALVLESDDTVTIFRPADDATDARPVGRAVLDGGAVVQVLTVVRGGGGIDSWFVRSEPDGPDRSAICTVESGGVLLLASEGGQPAFMYACGTWDEVHHKDSRSYLVTDDGRRIRDVD